MIKKIVSGGQTGVDQAALDAAIKSEIAHGGWVPQGRLTESGRLPGRYLLQELQTTSYSVRTEQNVLDSDGTLIISHGPLIGGSKYTLEVALKHRKPHLHIDLNETSESSAAKSACEWIRKNGIEILNVAGPRSSVDPHIYHAAMQLMTKVLLLCSHPDIRGKRSTR